MLSVVHKGFRSTQWADALQMENMAFSPAPWSVVTGNKISSLRLGSVLDLKFWGIIFMQLGKTVKLKIFALFSEEQYRTELVL